MRRILLLLFVFTLFRFSYAIENMTLFYGIDTNEKFRLIGISGEWDFSRHFSLEMEGAFYREKDFGISANFLWDWHFRGVIPYIILGIGWKEEVISEKEKFARYYSFGGGVKLHIYKNLNMRFDYRNMRFSTLKRQRLYGGLNLRF